MLIAVAISIIVPFELFLFSYAILGPLHYLTEISWLHDRDYYSKHHYDRYILIAIGIGITLVNLSGKINLPLQLPVNSLFYLSSGALLFAVLFALIRDNRVRIWCGLLILTILYAIAPDELHNNPRNAFVLYLVILLPTLIHVYLFTWLFMLYGAIKSKSRLGFAAVCVLLVCPVLLWHLFPAAHPFEVTDFGKDAYIGHGLGFRGINQSILTQWLDIAPDLRQIQSQKEYDAYWIITIFHSQTGILLMRCIAFAYTYHYLNWFSKTRVIQWHHIPKTRFITIIVLWLLSIAIYLYDYAIGLQWLFFLSVAHVLLELPLNITSITGIGRALFHKNSNVPGTKQRTSL